MSSSATVFKRVKHEPSDGQSSTQYSIQLLDRLLIDEAALFYVKYFCSKENLSSSVDKRFSKSETTSIKWVTKYLSEGMTLAAFLEDDEGNKGALIGLNVLFLRRNAHSEEQDPTNEDPSEKVELSESGKIICRTEADIGAKADVFTLYNCWSYMDCAGLVVAPEYERRGIAGELLRAVGQVCRMTDTPVCATTFSSEASQKTAARCGFQTLAELDLTTYRVNGQIVYPNPKWPVVKLMAKRYS